MKVLLDSCLKQARTLHSPYQADGGNLPVVLCYIGISTVWRCRQPIICVPSSRS
jgi:hypothetical protein